ncbi:MAG: tripartite tricarboxylate transporter TctB family protein [Betaproteobacteria bacterium]|nr:tripartite tricarboxylate transporter TctB family protein [Betaproteobacteria bacterium]
MMDRLKAQIPYFVVLLISGFLYYRATQFDFVAPRGRIGPDVWPKAILILAMLTCVYEILKNLLFAKQRQEVAGVLESIIDAAPVEASVETMLPAPGTYAGRLLIGASMTIAYAALINTLGFFICTVLFLAGFTWVGRYRRPGVIAATSVIGGLAFMFMFMKIVYVSLPLGVGPFGQLSVQLMRLMGIR